MTARQMGWASIENGELLALAAEHCVAIMCSEADPTQCHREKLIARSLRARGVEVTHILPDGSAAAVAQPTLFEVSSQ